MTKEQVLADIQRWYQQYRTVDFTIVAEHAPSLYWNARRLFGSWRAAVEAAGINYDAAFVHRDIRSAKEPLPIPSPLLPCKAQWTVKIKRPRYRWWTEEEIIATIQWLAKKKQPLYPAAVIRSDWRFYSAARRRFGNWRNALRAAGIDPDTVGVQYLWAHKWSPERVCATIRALAEHNYPLYERDIRQTYRTLYEAARKYFGGWRQAVIAAGLPYRPLRKRRKQKGGERQ